MSRIYLSYKDAASLIQEGDILLFRGTGFISNLIKMAGEGEYSHVAIASRHNGHWEAVEFREWYGGRTISLENYIAECAKCKTEIDVYRPNDTFTSIRFDGVTREFITHKLKFNGKEITNCMRHLTGFPYSYKRIWLILKIKLFKWRILMDSEKITNEIPTKEIVYPVCSTVLAHCLAINNYLVLRRKSDQYIEPSDFSISPRLNYAFTLTT